MQLAELARRYPGLYEFYKAVFSPIARRKNKKRNELFAKYTLEQLMDYDREMFHERQGRYFDWNNLETYTEKMQYEKIFDKNPLKSQLTDKYKVRDWVAEKIGEQYLIPLIGVWDNIKSVDFHQLPNQFVIKTNHGSCDVVVVKDKKCMGLSDWMRLKRVIRESMDTNYAVYAYELHYSDIEPKVIVEEYIDSGDKDLQDYKFLCFDGVPYYCWVDVGRFHNHKRNVYDMDWNLQEWNQFHYGNANETVNRPKNFETMIEIAKTLSAGFSHVRVDLYNVNGTIYFGEMTFTNGSGFEEITPASADKMLGDLWKLQIQY